MHRILFTARSTLGREHAVLDIGPSAMQWHFVPNVANDPVCIPAAAAEPAGTQRPKRLARPSMDALPSRPRQGRSLILQDYAHRWPVYERRRRWRRWKAERAEIRMLMVNDLREKYGVLRDWLRAIWLASPSPSPIDLTELSAS